MSRSLPSAGQTSATKKAKINSRQKGVRGELELRDLFRRHGYEAYRGQQHSGGGDSPDVVSNVPGIHAECKRLEAGNPYRWMEQAIRDAGDRVPIVFHKRNGKEWLAILRAEDLFRYLPKPKTEFDP